MNTQDDVTLIRTTSDENRPGFIATLHRAYTELVDTFNKSKFFDRWHAAPMDIRFRLTNRCNENCARCFECSGINNPLVAIPATDVLFYMRQHNKWKSVCMTGGEWSLVYDLDEHYLLRLFNDMPLDNSGEYMIQTNCRWLFGRHRANILDDLKQIQYKLGQGGKILKLDTSVDRYHSATSLRGVQELIAHVAQDSDFSYTKIRILSCRLDWEMTNKVVLVPEFFAARGVDLKFEKRNLLVNPYFQICYANNTRIVIHEEGVTMQIGRAAKNKFGYKIYSPERQCGGLADDNRVMELSLREDGNIKWHSFYDWDIMTPYRDENGNNKPISQIKSELIQKAWQKRLRYNGREFFMMCVPGLNVARAMWINRQMKKSFQENSQKIQLQVQKVL